MAEALKVLGQIVGTAADAVVYTVPASTQTTISTITVCNRNTASGNFDIRIRRSGQAADNKEYIYFQQFLDQKSTYASTIGITLATGDAVYFNGPATMTINIFGIEVS